MILTTQQDRAMSKIKEFIANQNEQVFILKGYAGTGKTTLISYIANYLQSINAPFILMAPTGRAAKILRTKLKDEEASTIHKCIYDHSLLHFEKSSGELKYIFPLKEDKERRIYIINEASMISSQKSNDELLQFGTGILINDILSYARLRFGGKIIFVGDPMQLPPVGDNRSVALDEDFFRNLDFNVSSYELTDIIRQKKHNSILTNAIMLRELMMEKQRNHLVFERKEGEVITIDAMDVAKEYCEDLCTPSAIVCFSNQQAANYNAAIRGILFPQMEHVVAGDKLMIIRNNYWREAKLMNGDIITVTAISDTTISQSAPVWTEKNGSKVRKDITLDFREISFQTEEGYIYSHYYIIDSLLQNGKPSLTIDETKALYINAVMRIRAGKGLTENDEVFVEALKEDPFFNALQVKYGYAFTCHKSQGGEWDTVYVDFAKRTGLDVDSLRWKYTAITRATQKLCCINLIDITPISSLAINPINKTSKISNEALSFCDVRETPYHSSSAPLAEKAKYWSVKNNMEGTQYSIKNVICKPWRNIYEVNAPNGIIRVDVIFNAAGLVTGYEMDLDDMELLLFFQHNENIVYKIEYKPTSKSLELLHNRMISLCDECGIVLTNVIERVYQLVYYMKTSGDYASITFYFDKKGFVKYAVPLSNIGDADEKLHKLIEKLK